MGQAQPRIQPGNPLDTSETTSNVATNRAMLDALKAANVDGKNINPAQVDTDHLYANNGIFQGYMASGSLFVGAGGVAVSSSSLGAEPSAAGIFMGISSGDPFFYLKDTGGNQTVTFNGTTGAATFKGTIASGSTVSATMTTGAIYVGSGGVTISNDAAANNGIVIDANQIRCIVGGSPTITIDGATGVVTAKKFTLTSDGDNNVDLTLGTHIFADAIQVGGTPGVTFTTMKSDTSTAQSTANTAVTNAATAQTTATNANTNAESRLIKAQTYFTLAGDQVTHINSAGITVGTGTGASAVRIYSGGLGCFNASSALVTAITTDGFYCKRVTSTEASMAAAERVSVWNSAGTPVETGYFLSGYSTSVAYVGGPETFQVLAGYVLGSGYSATGELTLAAGDQININPGLGGGVDEIIIPATTAIRFGAGGQTIEAGSGTPSHSATDGSLFLSGGSFWLRYSSSWTRIYGTEANAATAHPT